MHLLVTRSTAVRLDSFGFPGRESARMVMLHRFRLIRAAHSLLYYEPKSGIESGLRESHPCLEYGKLVFCC